MSIIGSIGKLIQSFLCSHLEQNEAHRLLHKAALLKHKSISGQRLLTGIKQIERIEKEVPLGVHANVFFSLNVLMKNVFC